MSRYRTHKQVLTDALKNPEFKKEWEATETQYQVIEKVIAQRLKHKLTQEQLAQRAGLKQANIARLESGGVLPSIRTLTKIAKAFDSKLEVSFTPAS